MPTNLYGPGDNYNLETSHVIPALIRKFYNAKRKGEKEVICWGTGRPKREFLHVDDLGDASVFALENWNPDESNSPESENNEKLTYLNVGTAKDITIKCLAETIAEILNFKGKILWDETKPDGTPQKLLDIKNISNLGWKPKISLDNGLKMTVNNFIEEFTSETIRI